MLLRTPDNPELVRLLAKVDETERKTQAEHDRHNAAVGKIVGAPCHIDKWRKSDGECEFQIVPVRNLAWLLAEDEEHEDDPQASEASPESLEIVRRLDFIEGMAQRFWDDHDAETVANLILELAKRFNAETLGEVIIGSLEEMLEQREADAETGDALVLEPTDQ